MGDKMDALKEKELFQDIMSGKYSPQRLMLKHGLTEEEFCRRYDDFRKNGRISAVTDWTWKRQGHLVECAGRSSFGSTGEKLKAEFNSKPKDVAVGTHPGLARYANFVRILGGAPRLIGRAVASLFKRVA
jgi:hypothetical protein